MTTAAPAAPTVTGEVAAARRQLVLYYAGAYDPDDQVEVRFIKAGADARSEWYTAAELPDAVDRLARANAAGWNVYLGANPRVGRGRRGDDAVKLARCVFADFDGPTVDGVLAKLAALGLPKPSLVVATGHGVHVYWRLETAQEDLAEWVGFQKDLIAHLGSDPRIFNPERIMRAPGFLNLKREPVPCAVASCDATRRFPFAMLRALVPPRPAQRPAPAANARADARQLNDDNRLERCWKYVQKCDDAISGSGGHDRTHHVACECYRFGLSDADAMEVLRRFNATKTGGEPWTEKELVHKLDSARRKVEADGKFGCRLTETRPGHGGNGLAKWDHLRAEAQQGAAEAKSVDLFGGPPIPLEPPAPPELEPGIFPPVVDDQIFAVADATETPPVLPATIGLVMLATACQGRFCVSPEYDYFEELAFWAAAGLEPGTRKTPALQRMAHWLYAWQKRKREEFQPLIDRATEHAIVTSRIKQLREKAAKAKDATEYGLLKQQALDAEKELPDVPVLPQAIVEDITSEHLATVLGQQGERLSVVSDEGGPLDNITGRYSDGITNADVYLKAYSGSAGSIDRGSRPSIFLRRPTLSMGLSPQPAVISAMVNNPSLRRRGFVARFWLFLPRSNLGYRTGQRHPVPETTAAAYAARLTELMDLPPEPDGNGGHRPRVLKLTGAAWRLWCDFAAEVEEMMRQDGELEDLRDWGGKLPGACVRVAGLFHCVERGADAIRETEGAASGKLTAHHFTRMLTEYDARFTGIPRGSKFVRSGAFNAACERRDVRLVRGTWNEAFIEELANFPAARHDDQVDAAVGAYEALSGAVEPWGAKELKAVFGPSAWEAKAAKSPHDLLMEQLGRH